MLFPWLGSGGVGARNQLAGGSLLDKIASLVLNPTLRKIVIKGGRRIIEQLQKLMGRYSLVGDREFFHPEHFPRLSYGMRTKITKIGSDA
jgi:hypothetical protein